MLQTTQKIASIFHYAGTEVDNITGHFRLGKEGEKPRPLKVTLNSNQSAEDILSKSPALKRYTKHKLYINPDRSKSEQKEYSCIGKRKKELTAANSQNVAEQARVLLKKGILTLDGIEVDRYNPIQSLF